MEAYGETLHLTSKSWFERVEKKKKKNLDGLIKARSKISLILKTYKRVKVENVDIGLRRRKHGDLEENQNVYTIDRYPFWMSNLFDFQMNVIRIWHNTSYWTISSFSLHNSNSKSHFNNMSISTFLRWLVKVWVYPKWRCRGPLVSWRVEEHKLLLKMLELFKA